MLAGDDVWLQILSLLEEKDVYALISCGSPSLRRIIGKRQSIFARGRWPSNVHSETPSLLELRTEDINLDARNSVVHGGHLELRHLPRTLTRLSLHVGGVSLPLWVVDVGHAPSQLERLGAHFPSLQSLDMSFNFRGPLCYWTLPPTLTRFSCLKPNNLLRFSHQITFPEKLQVFISKDGVMGDRRTILQAMQALKDLRVLIWESMYSEYLSAEPCHVMSQLQTLHLGRYAPQCPLINIPSATAVSGNVFFTDEMSAAHPLKHLRSPGWLGVFPQGLEKWTLIDSRRRVRLMPLHVSELRRLPPSFQYLRLYSYDVILDDYYTLLPPQLLLLDIQQVTFDLKRLLPVAPPTLTALRVCGLNHVTAKLLSRFTNLRELVMFGGRMTANLARILPRSLRSLSLQSVALTTTGKYQLKGTGEIIKYSISNPDTTALHAANLPPLTYLNITPKLSHLYWYTHFYDILADIPTSLEHLILHFREHEPISLYPKAEPIAPPAWDGLPPGTPPPSSNLPPPPSGPTNLFSRLTNLIHLYFYCRAVVPAERGWLVKSLPPSLFALHFFLLNVADDMPNVPRSIRYITRHDSSPNSYKNYEDSHDWWRGPKEKDVFSFFAPSEMADPYY